jgi:hypothetical protein
VLNGFFMLSSPSSRELRLRIERMNGSWKTGVPQPRRLIACVRGKAACRDPHRVGWFGSVEVPGGGEEVVIVGSGRWWNPDELNAQPQSTMRGEEIEPPPNWFGSYEFGAPGR